MVKYKGNVLRILMKKIRMRYIFSGELEKYRIITVNYKRIEKWSIFIVVYRG